MKKFIIAICSVMLACGAMGAKESAELHKVSKDLGDKWQSNSGNFNKDLSNRFMKSWLVGETHQAGACGENDEGAGVAIIATDIFTNGNGAKFCTRQIQSANGGGKSWIDIYDTKGYDKCNVFCKQDHYGPRCERTQRNDCDHKDYTKEFDNVMDDATVNKLLETTSTYCNDESKIKTDNTPAFVSVINKGEDDTSSYAIVLGVLEVKEHAIIVGPVRIDAKRKKGSRNDSWISAVSGNGNEMVLCAEGYEPNIDGTDCELSYWCSGVTPVCSDENENLFKESLHDWGVRENNGEPCKYITCKSGYGLKEGTVSKECIPCATTRTQGINADGVCEPCDNDQMFKDGGCKRYTTTYSIQELKKGIKQAYNCWMEARKEDYKRCVECDGEWNKNEKTCQGN